VSSFGGKCMLKITNREFFVGYMFEGGSNQTIVDFVPCGFKRFCSVSRGGCTIRVKVGVNLVGKFFP